MFANSATATTPATTRLSRDSGRTRELVFAPNAPLSFVDSDGGVVDPGELLRNAMLQA